MKMKIIVKISKSNTIKMDSTTDIMHETHLYVRENMPHVVI